MDAGQTVTVGALVSTAPVRVDLSLVRPPPAAIVHPVGPACVTFFYTLTCSCCVGDTEPAVTDQCSPSHKDSEKVAKLTTRDYSTAARVVLFYSVKCKMYVVKQRKQHQDQNSHWAATNLQRYPQGYKVSGFVFPLQTPFITS